METEVIETNIALQPQAFYCPRHTERQLIFMLKGGAGYCSACRLYTQALDVPMPAVDKPEQERKRRKVLISAVAEPDSTSDGADSQRIAADFAAFDADE